jgi:hypothetical protein
MGIPFDLTRVQIRLRGSESVLVRSKREKLYIRALLRLDRRTWN